MRLIAVCLIVSLLSGCAIPLSEQRATLDRAPPCCTGFDGFKYRPLSLPSETTISLSSDAPAFVFKHGKSFFNAYALPPWSGPYTLSVWHQPTATAMSPVITLLDEGFAITREFDRAKGRSGTGYRQIVDVFVNAENQKERYLVISARSAAEEGTLETKTFTPFIIPIGTAAIVANGSELKNNVSFGPMGTLTLTLTPYQPTIVGQP